MFTSIRTSITMAVVYQYTMLYIHIYIFNSLHRLILLSKTLIACPLISNANTYIQHVKWKNSSNPFT